MPVESALACQLIVPGLQVREPMDKHSEVVEKVLDMLESQASNLTQVWFLCAAHGSVLSASMPEKARLFQQAAGDRMVRLYTRIASQQGTPRNQNDNDTVQDNQTTEFSTQADNETYSGFAQVSVPELISLLWQWIFEMSVAEEISVGM